MHASEEGRVHPGSCLGDVPTDGSHIRERADGKRSPKNSTSAPVRDVQDVPAVTIIPNQAPK
jgi:hypothetical protein